MNEFTFHVNNINDIVSLIYTVEYVLPNLGKNLELTITNKDGVEHMVRVTINTQGVILDIFDEHVEAADSEGDLFRGHNNISTIRVEFADRRLNGRRTGGYFPYWDLSTIDLSRYGIYKTDNHPKINQICLVTAFE